jgi:NADPH:quinone reductase-like Zn-dependent oxidoreductase
MRALVVSGKPDPRLELREVPEPQPKAGDVVVEVHAASINRGEIRRLATAAEGSRFGWDIGGVIAASDLAPAAPPIGARVVGQVSSGGWAESVAVPASDIALMPDGLSMAQAAAIPTAGLTALRALRIGGALLGKAVLVAGAQGAVGRYACRLAELQGARVTALGRDRSVLQDKAFDLIVDPVGGEGFAELVGRLRVGATMVVVGNTAGTASTLDVRVLVDREANVHGFRLASVASREPFGPDLTLLAGLVAAGSLDAGVGKSVRWDRSGDIQQALEHPDRSGKTILLLR